MTEQTSKAWYLGNTTVRNPRRLKEGLRILFNSSFHANLAGKMNEQGFARLLDQEGLVHVKRLRVSPEQDNNDIDEKDASDVGRKWRSAMMQIGFILPGPKLCDEPYAITSNGQRLLHARILPEEQECFLRSLLAQQIPSQIESFGEYQPFCPLRIVLNVLSRLEEKELDAWISQDEMASIVQLITNLEDVDEAVQRIAEYRTKLKEVTNSKRFIKEYRENVAYATKANGKSGQSANTLKDYADSNFRYLKLTGLFAESGRRLRFADYKRTTIDQLLATPYTPVPSERYLEHLWNGASLPTDNASKAIQVILSTSSILKRRPDLEWIETLTRLAQVHDLTQLSEKDLSQLRLGLEDDMLKLREVDFAKEQGKQWENILEYLQDLMRPRPKLVPNLETPAYLEWTLWRAFLAINSLVNKPWDARRFKIDEELKPVNPAPGGGPDMIFEFEDLVLVVEVTLTTSSRQEAAEGEPVRRHVANLVDHYQMIGKRVFGVFIANKVDTNTAETFRSASWYRPDDTQIEPKIVPFTLIQFAKLFETAFQVMNSFNYRMLEEVIVQCIDDKTDVSAPEWKRRIDQRISTTVKEIQYPETTSHL